MNKILNLFDQEFIIKFFTKRILPHYPDFKAIKKVKILPVKKHVWETTYHVVIEYEATFVTKNGKYKKLPIFCSAHSSDPRKSVHLILKHLWDNNFSRGFLTIPHPLFYSNYYKAVFYRGVNGHNLLHYLKKQNYDEIEIIVKKTAAWLAKLHSLPTKGAINFNEKSNRIETAIPGKKRILDIISNNYPDFLDSAKSIYEVLEKREKKFFKSTSKRWLIHGDAHPENVIKVGRKKIALIDFTDLCLSDFARDIGSFMQQLDYMYGRKTGDWEYAEKLKNIFLGSYLKQIHIKILGDSLKERINTYYNWTAFRTAMFFLLKHDPNPKRADELFGQICHDLGIFYDFKIITQ